MRAATLTSAILAALRFAGRLSVEVAGAFGDARVIAALLEGPLQLVGRDDDGFPRELGRTIAHTLYSRHSLPLDSLQTFSPDLLVAARLVVNDLFQAFGVAETPAINSDGALRACAFPTPAEVAEWATRHGIEVVE